MTRGRYGAGGQYCRSWDWEGERADHYKMQCRHCERLVTQCRCPDLNKKTILVTCEECREAGKDDDERREAVK